MNERKAGWYWVKTDYQSEWEAAQFDGDDWHVTGADQKWDESMLDEIGSRIPTPDEPWATVPVQPDESMIDAAFWAWGSTDVRSVYIDMISSAPKPEDK